MNAKSVRGNKNVLNHSIIFTDASQGNLTNTPNLAKVPKINLPIRPIALGGKN